jgi:hypothetical protein
MRSRLAGIGTTLLVLVLILSACTPDGKHTLGESAVYPVYINGTNLTGPTGATGPAGPAGGAQLNNQPGLLHNFVYAVDNTTGVVSIAQPSTANLSDFPAQAGHNGEFLTTDGASLSFAAVSGSSTNVSNDVSTNATVYPVWSSSTSGALAPKTSSTNLTYNPLTAYLST